mgnify:CR=1 FL=1
MNIARLSEDNYFGVFAEAEKILNSGGVIIAPTDTVYGILGRADDAKTIKKIFALKKRKDTEALPVFVKDIAQARHYAYNSDAKAKFLERVWPGKVTVVFHHKEKLPEVLTAGKDTIGLRIPNENFLLKLLEQVEFPIAQTSANIAGKSPAQNKDEIKSYFTDPKNQPDLVVDGGEISGQSSTVINFTGAEPTILRTGMMSREDFDRMSNWMV